LVHALLNVSSRVTTQEVDMQSIKKRISLLAVPILVAGILGSIGCNTIKGMGRDIERGGEKTQDAAESVRRRL
jgi:predicted small secreted protein